MPPIDEGKGPFTLLGGGTEREAGRSGRRDGAGGTGTGGGGTGPGERGGEGEGEGEGGNLGDCAVKLSLNVLM